MRNNIWITIIMVFSLIISFRNYAYAKQGNEKCRQIPYSPPRQGARPYRVDRIEGRAVVALASQRDEISAGGICLVLFNEKDKKPVAVTTTNDTGQFELKEVAPGTYTLVASVDNEELHKIVLPIRLYATKAKGSRRQGILLHLRTREDGRKSYATPIRNPALREELLQMLKLDQSVRKDMPSEGGDQRDQSMQEKRRSIDAANLARLKVILQKYGWPRPGLVGGKEPAFYPIKDEANVDKRRAKLHLSPLSEYREFLKKYYFPQTQNK